MTNRTSAAMLLSLLSHPLWQNRLCQCWAVGLVSSRALEPLQLRISGFFMPYRPIGHTTNVYTMLWHGALHYISRRSLRSRLSPTLRYFHLMPMMPNKFRIQTTRSRSLYIDFSEIDAYLRSASFSHIHARWKSASRPNSQPNALIVPQAWHSHWSLNPQPRAVTRSSLVTWDHTWLHAPFLAQHHWHCRNFNARLTEWLQNGSKWGMNKGTLAILGWQSSVYTCSFQPVRRNMLEGPSPTIFTSSMRKMSISPPELGIEMLRKHGEIWLCKPWPLIDPSGLPLSP